MSDAVTSMDVEVLEMQAHSVSSDPSSLALSGSAPGADTASLPPGSAALHHNGDLPNGRSDESHSSASNPVLRSSAIATPSAEDGIAGTSAAVHSSKGERDDVDVPAPAATIKAYAKLVGTDSFVYYLEKPSVTLGRSSVDGTHQPDVVLSASNKMYGPQHAFLSDPFWSSS